MICMSCQTELPQEAVFCWRCGTPQKALVPIEPTHPPVIPEYTSTFSPGASQIFVASIGEHINADYSKGILVVYGGNMHRERILRVGFRKVEIFGSNVATVMDEVAKVRLKERRVNGLSVLAAITQLDPDEYWVYLGYHAQGNYLIEAGEITEVDFRI